MATETKTETETGIEIWVSLPTNYPSYFGVGSNPPDRDYTAVAVRLASRQHETLCYQFESTEEAERQADILRSFVAELGDPSAALAAWEDAD